MCSSICSPLNVNLNTLQITFNHNVLKMPYKRASTEICRTCKTCLFVCLFVCVFVCPLHTLFSQGRVFLRKAMVTPLGKKLSSFYGSFSQYCGQGTFFNLVSIC
jgi:hypothetical protein